MLYITSSTIIKKEKRLNYEFKFIIIFRSFWKKFRLCCNASYIKGKISWHWLGNLTELEEVINAQAAKGYRLHTITTSNGGSKGLMGGDRIQATLVFEKIK